MPLPTKAAIIPSALITQKIYFVRGMRVLLDCDLAKLYGVATANLNKAVARNRERFPADFMFPLQRGGRKKFTIPNWNSKESWSRGPALPAVRVDRTGRGDAKACRGAECSDEAMEKRYDARFRAVFETIRQMLETPVPMEKAIGFHLKTASRAKSTKPTGAKCK